MLEHKDSYFKNYFKTKLIFLDFFTKNLFRDKLHLTSFETPPKFTRQNPRTPKPQTMIDEVVNNESETSDDSSSSDDPKSPQNVPNDYEKQRELRISQNRAKMEAMGLKKIANSLVDSGIKRKSQLKSKSKRVSMNGVEDDLYNPNDEDEDDDSDSSLNSSSEELEEDQKGKKKNKKKKNKKILNVTNSGYASKKVFILFCLCI